MSLPPPQGDNPIITQFQPRDNQWELTDENIKRIDPRIGETILHNYCRYINTTPLEVYRYLIEVKGCDINLQDDNKDIPLYRALCCFDPNEGGDIKTLTYLLSQKGINVNIKGEYGETLLHIACININNLPVDIFKLLIETHGFDPTERDKDGNTPIHSALAVFNPSIRSDITVLMYLLSHKNVNIHTKGPNDILLFHWACLFVNVLPLDVFKCLIEIKGGDVTTLDDTFISYSLHAFNPELGSDAAVANLKYLIDQVNPNTKNRFGYTLLHTAFPYVNKLSLDLCKYLIETKGCSINIRDDGDQTPFCKAFLFFDSNNGGDVAVLTYLLTQKGIDVNIKGQFDRTLLHYACDNINRLPLDIFKVLIEKLGYDVNAQDKDNHTPLHNAIYCFNSSQGDVAVLAYLLNQTNIGVNTKYTKGFTLLHSACIINPSNTRYYAKQDAECDAISCQIVEVIVERCVQQVLDEITTP
jgi:ankyrin repeat protein